MKTLKSLETKLKSLKSLNTAEKYLNKFKESTCLDFNFEFSGKNVYAGHDTVSIYVDSTEVFSITYDKAVLF